MPSFSIRLDDETFDRVKAKGGSRWVRDMLAAALWGSYQAEVATGLVTSDEVVEELPLGDPGLELYQAEDTVEQILDGPPSPEKAFQPSATATLVEDICPRWMHHKPTELCLVCGATPER